MGIGNWVLGKWDLYSSFRAASFITDYLVLPVGAATGPSHQPGKASEPGSGWACRAAADLIEPTIDSILSGCRCGCLPFGAWLGLSSSRLASDRTDYPTPVQSVQPPVRPAWKANESYETGDPMLPSDRLSDRPSRSPCRCGCLPFSPLAAG